ncbi:MAG: DNA-3-methyladenine glycosylase I, partial [Oscillospiraceae bacterium]|nr:DNA-3-methyladenine glycosylase I [Oscillospiraceae bacterium]
MPKRCFWAPENDPVYLEYHDTEWGVPCHDDAKLYEMLILESFQAGLSWACVLHKREAFRRAYDGFDVTKVARYDAVQQERLMNDPGIIRNRLKIRASVLNSI